ncbi:hypothetical protein MY1884_003403 [Beauveria asiatica]
MHQAARARRAATILPRDAAAQRPAAGVARRAGPAACASGPSAAPPSPTAKLHHHAPASYSNPWRPGPTTRSLPADVPAPLPIAHARECTSSFDHQISAAAPARRAYSSERAPPANQDSVRRPQSTTTAPPPVCDDTDPVTRVSSSSSAGVCPGHRSGAFARRHEIGGIHSRFPLSNRGASRRRCSLPRPSLLLHPHHHPISTTSPPLPAPSQDMYCDLGAGGYMAMTAPDAQCPAPGFGPVSDLDTLLYSAEGVNWVVSPDPVRIYRRPLTDFF